MVPQNTVFFVPSECLSIGEQRPTISKKSNRVVRPPFGARVPLVR